MRVCISRFIYYCFLAPFCYYSLSLLILLIFTGIMHFQVFNVRGNIFTDATPVRYALITFIDQIDTMRLSN